LLKLRTFAIFAFAESSVALKPTVVSLEPLLIFYNIYHLKRRAMSNFFDNKARARQAAEASSSKNKTATTTKEDADSHKPWVEK